MSASGESESKVDAIIRKMLEKYDSLGENRDFTKQGVAGIYDMLQENDLLPQLMKAQKSDRESEHVRAAGNAAYKTKDFDEAMSRYTRAICCAVPEGEPIALAYANRSAVHYELQAHDDVIKDVDHALATGKYPESLKHKLYERRGKSYMALSKYQTALEDLKKVMYHVTNGKLDGEKGTTHRINGDFVEKITSNGDLDQEKIISHLMNGKADPEKVLHVKQLVELIAKCVGKQDLPQTRYTVPKLSHKPLKNTSSPFPAMEIAVSPEMGKHVVATTNISPGDVLAVEKPYVSVLTPEFFSHFCDNCKTRSSACIPCDKCNNVVFCSEVCRRKGWESHHLVECDLLPTVMDLGCKVNVLIGIRGLLQATRCGRDLQRFVDEVSGSKASGGKSKDKLKATKTTKSPNTHHDAYHSVHHLVTHEADRGEVQMLVAMATVSCIVHVLKGATKFFGTPSSEKSLLGLNHIVAADLISRYFMMAGCNAFEIGESTFTPREDFTDYDFRIIGGALYPTLCLLNHSCDPDVAAYMSSEETRVLYAVKPVRKGDQIYISYGPEYIHHDLSTRRKELKTKYFFTCKCPACANDWPLAHNLPEYPTFISHRVESAQGSRIFDTCQELPGILQAADKGPISQEQLQAVVQSLSLYHKYVIRPWKYYFAAQRVIRRHFNYKGKHNICKLSRTFT